jgi:asparagine synthase (glutamine-hydrolysing)
MCGIAGLIGAEPQQAVLRVRRMMHALARRGPDSEGLEVLPGAVLGHRRLAIFDRSDAGHQPMTVSSPAGPVSVVFNGAIYNFRTLRSELETAGYSFRSQTDTEVLLHGYLHWGFDQMVGRLRGMFAIGLWDDSHQTLYLARDRLGVKPLHFAHQGNQIAFASTPHALNVAGLASEIDQQALTEYLEFGYVTDACSIYLGAAKVQAGEILEFRSGSVDRRTYWRLSDAGTQQPVFAQAVDRVEELFLDAVRLRLQADVPVGALLSAGVDSSLVCWAMSKLGANITVFTVGTGGGPEDESTDARRTALELGLQHHVIDLSPDETPSIAELVGAFGEPFACASALGMLRISRAVRESATVLLTGDGGDDVFLGYPEHKHFLAAQRIARALPPGSTALWRNLRTLLPHKGLARRAKHFLDYATGGLGAVTRAHPGLDDYQRTGMLGPRLFDARLPQRDIPLSHASARRLLTDFLTYDRGNRFTGEYMTKVDGATMHYSLEARSPFLDQELWNFASSLPYATRLHGGRSKAILRELARRHLGERVSQGRKRGFSVPVNRWLVERWRATFQEMFADSLLARDGWISGPAVQVEFRRATEQGYASNQLWYLYVLEHWLRNRRTAS